MYTFTKSFIKQADSVADELGLINSTSERQRKNGTISYVDPVTGVSYMLYRSGYIRRATVGNTWSSRYRTVIYQLNPIRRINVGIECNGYRTVRVALAPLEQLAKLTTSVISYRKTNSIKPK